MKEEWDEWEIDVCIERWDREWNEWNHQERLERRREDRFESKTVVAIDLLFNNSY